jgi:hypothetical protein
MRERERKPADRATPPIGENHRRRISAALGLIDQALGRWAQYAAGAEDTGSFRHLRNDLTADERQTLGNVIAEIRALLTELGQGLALKTQVRSVRGTLPGECGILWETIAGLDPQHLKAWGSTDAEFDDYWEPRRQMLEALLNRVMAVVSGKR